VSEKLVESHPLSFYGLCHLQITTYIYLNLLVLVLKMAAIGDQNLQPPLKVFHCLTSFIDEVNSLCFGVAICKRVETLKMYSIFHGPMKRDLTLRTIKYRTYIHIYIYIYI